MEHTFKIEKELKITTENIVDCVLSCEAGGFDYWGELCSDEKDYEAARQRLAEREKADMKPCYEDVLAEILESGGKLTVYDREDDKDHELTLEKLLNGNGKIEYIRELAEGEEAVKFGRAAGY